MIIVCGMCNYEITRKRCNHDPQTIYPKIIVNRIAQYVDYKPYAQLIFIGCCR